MAVDGKPMEHSSILRRTVHLSAPVFLVYYFLPSPLWYGGPPKEIGLLTVLAATMTFELARLLIGFKVPGLRPYESDQMSAAAWTSVALTFSFLFFPIELTAPVIFGMALVDPAISILRRTRWYPWLPYAMHLTVMLLVLALLVPVDLRWLFAATVVSGAAVASEAVKTRYVDDDFLMIVVPLLVFFLTAGP